MKIPVSIVDDKSQNRLSLQERINYSTDLEVVFTAAHGNDFLEQLRLLPRERQPRVVLMDIEMPERNGIETVRIAKSLYPHINFLMLTVFDDEDKIFEAIKAGATGYLLKDEKLQTIVDYIHQLIEVGGAPMSPPVARKAWNLLVQAAVPGKEETSTPSQASELSDREKEVLRLTVDGYEYKAIADMLFLSGHTVRRHIANIYRKLQVTSKAQAIKVATRNKLL